MFSLALSFVFFWDPYDLNIGVLNVVPEVSDYRHFFFIIFSLMLCSVVCFGVSMGSVWLWAACLLMCQGCAPLLLKDWRELSSTGTCWVLGGTWS